MRTKLRSCGTRSAPKVSFFLHPQMVVIGISYFASPKENMRALEEDRQKFAPFTTDIIGETSLFIGKPKDEKAPRVLFEAGSLWLLESENIKHHHFSFAPAKSELLMPFLKQDFPNVDGVIHKIEREINYFQT